MDIASYTRRIVILNPGGNPLKYRITDAVHEMELEEEQVLIHVDSAELYNFDDVGQLVWKHLKDGLNTTEIVKQICVVFNNSVSEAEVLSDVNELLKHLLNSGLIHPVSE